MITTTNENLIVEKLNHLDLSPDTITRFIKLVDEYRSEISIVASETSLFKYNNTERGREFYEGAKEIFRGLLTFRRSARGKRAHLVKAGILTKHQAENWTRFAHAEHFGVYERKFYKCDRVNGHHQVYTQVQPKRS